MSLLDTALRIADYKPEPFVAPVPTNGIVDIFTLQNKVPLRYTLRGQIPGWWEIIPQGRKAVLGGAAKFHEVVEYLEALPRFYVIACIPSGEHCWLVVPYNSADASQRGWKDGAPKQVYLANVERIEPFDVLSVRNLAGILLYESLDYRLGSFTLSQINREALIKISSDSFPHERNWRNAFNIVAEWQAKVEQDARLAKIETQMSSAVDKMKFMLEFMGARLVANEKKGKGYLVTWQAPDGHTYKMGVREDGRISVAGFCLAGTDSQHNLSSIVQVMEEAHRRERPDVQQAYADYERDDYDNDYDEDD